MFDFLDLPYRAAKPRLEGITHVIDTGMSLREAEDLVTVASGHVDIVKLGWGTAVVTQLLQPKIELYASAGIAVACGGTLVERAIVEDKVEQLAIALDQLGVTHVEVSDGSIELPRERKLQLIAWFAERFVTLSEVGFKDDREPDAGEWAQWAGEELASGAWKVVTEARESGTTGIYDGSGAPKTSLIDELVAAVPAADLIFEAPQKAQQVWFLRQLGPAANLGNIAPTDVISLETLRLGLRGDTLLESSLWPRGVRA